MQYIVCTTYYVALELHKILCLTFYVVCIDSYDSKLELLTRSFMVAYSFKASDASPMLLYKEYKLLVQHIYMKINYLLPNKWTIVQRQLSLNYMQCIIVRCINDTHNSTVTVQWFISYIRLSTILKNYVNGFTVIGSQMESDSHCGYTLDHLTCTVQLSYIFIQLHSITCVCTSNKYIVLCEFRRPFKLCI